MFLKLVSALPEYIYSGDSAGIFVNLFIGSEYSDGKVKLRQVTRYPWKGTSQILVDAAREGDLTIRVRVPGWAQSKENHMDLYYSKVTEAVTIRVNGKQVAVAPEHGYAAIKRHWKKGDKIDISLPVQPRLVFPNDSVQTIKGKAAIASGPVIYGLEGLDNAELDDISISKNAALQLSFKPALLGGVNVVSGTAVSKGKASSFTAIPFFTLGNRGAVSPYKVWLPLDGRLGGTK
jgi:DUF1680 family protein